MHLILDGEERPLDTSDCANLAELVALAESCDVPEEATVVVSIEVDGRSLSPEELAGLESQALAGVERVAIWRRPTRSVALSVLEQGADYTGQIATAIDRTVEAFRSGRSDQGNRLLADVTDSLTVLTGITYSAASVLEEAGDPLSGVQEGLYPWLEEMLSAQSDADPLRIADLLEYEIKPRVEDWGASLRALASQEPKPGEGSIPLSS